MGAQHSVDESVYTTGTHGPEHFFTLSQQQIASLVRVGLDLDKVLNPYQMERLNDDNDSKIPEVASSIHVNNASHINPKTLSFHPVSVQENMNGVSFNMRLRYSSSVPFVLSLYLFAEEVNGADGCPSIVPIMQDETLAAPYTVRLSPSLDTTYEIPIPSAFTERLPLIANIIEAAAVTAAAGVPQRSIRFTLSSSPLLTDAILDEFEAVKEKLTSAAFHHMVLQVESVIPVNQPEIQATSHRTPLTETFGYGSTGESQGDASASGNGYQSHSSPRSQTKGFAPVEWTFVKLKHTMAQVGHQSEVVAMTVDHAKRAIAAGKGLFEGLEIYGWPDAPEEDRHNSNAIGSDVTINVDGESGCPDCVICMSTLSQLVILPCRHLCLCIDCAKTLNTRAESNQDIKCPMCREKVGGYVDIRP